MSFGGDAPPAPDYRGAAEETGASSLENTRQQTYANRPNQTTPWGSSQWQSSSVIDPSTGKPTTQWDQTLTLGKEQQAALDAQNRIQAGKSDLAEGMMGRVGADFDQPFDYGNLPAPGSAPQAGTPGGLPPMGAAPDINLPSDNPLGQAGLDGMMQGGGDQFSQIGQYGSVPGQGGGGESTDPRQRAEDAIYGRSTSRMDPRFEQQGKAIENRLYNKGLRPGDEAYDAEMRKFEETKTDAYQTAMNEAIMGGGAEASRTFGMDLSSQQAQQGLQSQQFQQAAALRGEAGRGSQAEFDQQMRRAAMSDQQRAQASGEQGQQFGQEMQQGAFQSQLRQQAIAEEMQRRGMSLNEINAILHGQQVNTPQMPSFMGSSKGDTVDYSGAATQAGNYGLDKYSADQAMMQSILSGASTLGAAFAPSDLRLKTGFERIYGKGGLSVHRWTWNDTAKKVFGLEGYEEGYSAYEVASKYPQHVSRERGYEVIHIAALERELEAA